jgi:hypothetical protein
MSVAFLHRATALRAQARARMSQAVQALGENDLEGWTRLSKLARELDAKAEHARSIDGEHRKTQLALERLIAKAQRSA